MAGKGRLKLFGQWYYIKTMSNEGDDVVIRCSLETEEYSDELDKAIQKFIQARKMQFPRFPNVTGVDFDKTKKVVIAYMEKISEPPDDIIGTILFAIDGDEFWKRNLMTLSSLSGVCKDGLTKYEHIKIKWLEAEERKNRSSGNSGNANQQQQGNKPQQTEVDFEDGQHEEL